MALNLDLFDITGLSTRKNRSDFTYWTLLTLQAKNLACSTAFFELEITEVIYLLSINFDLCWSMWCFILVLSIFPPLPQVKMKLHLGNGSTLHSKHKHWRVLMPVDELEIEIFVLPNMKFDMPIKFELVKITILSTYCKNRTTPW